MSFGRKQFRALHWRLALFYTSVLAVLLLALGVYLDRQLNSYALTELQDRLIARAGGPSERQRGSLPPPLVVQAETPPSLDQVAVFAARTDRAGITTTILDAAGRVVEPSPPPADWRSPGNVSGDLFQAALSQPGPVGPRVEVAGSARYLVLDRQLGFTVANGPRGVIQTSVPLADVDTLVTSFRVAFGLGALATIALTLAAGKPMAQLALRPLRAFTSSLARVTASSLSEPLPVPAPEDDLRQLSLEFNAMLAKIDAGIEAERKIQSQLRQSQEQLGRFVADASHELRSPLTALSGYVDLIMEPDTPELAEKVAPNMRRELDRMNRLVRDLLALTRLDASPAEPATLDDVDLGQIADDMVSAATAAAGNRRLELALALDEGPWVRGDPFSIERVLENLLQNAIQYTGEDGHIEVQVDRQGELARVAVRDDGQGIPPEHLARVFDRFYRVDASRARANGNAGLGLAITKAIVTQHGGTISVQSQPGRGSTFTVMFPAIEYKYA